MSHNTETQIHVVVTGKHPAYNRAELAAELRAVGASMENAVTSSTHVLFNLGSRDTVKLKEARALQGKGLAIDIMGRGSLDVLLASRDDFIDRCLDERVKARIGLLPPDPVAKGPIPSPPQLPSVKLRFALTF